MIMTPSRPVLAVLVVDDHPLVRGVVGRVLEHYGWVVFEAEDPLEAVSLVRSASLPIRCLIARMQLPGMPATALADEIAAVQGSVPALYYSAASPYGGRGLNAREAFLREPFGVSDLIAKLADVFDVDRSSPAPAVPSRPGHLVKLYESAQGLAAAVGPFLSQGLEAGERVFAVVTAGHWSAISSRMIERGVDPAAAQAGGRLTVLDASATLERLRPGEMGDTDRFQALVRSLGESAGRRRAYGEMVDLLWKSGRLDLALRLEGFWNEHLTRVECTLLCGYHQSVTQCGDSSAYVRIAGCHSHVVPA
jgi:CheY-like chemotaxis protein